MLLLLAYTLVWYSASVVCNTSAKQLLFQHAPLPLWVSLFQFLTATLVLKLYLSYHNNKPTPTPSTPAQRLAFTRLAVSYTLGFVFVNSGYLAVTVSLAETLRSAEPLFSVLLAKLLLAGNEPISLATASTLLPIVLGGVLSSAGDASFTAWGLAFVSCSNVMFALRSVFTKQLKLASYPGNAIQTFYLVSRFGLFMLVGLCLVAEVAFGAADKTEYTLAGNWAKLAASPEVTRLLLINGITYAAYNQMSFLVLSMVTVVTHAVANSCRRIVTILVSVWMFGNAVSAQNASGILLAICGVILYSVSKARDEASAAAAPRGQ